MQANETTATDFTDEDWRTLGKHVRDRVETSPAGPTYENVADWCDEVDGIGQWASETLRACLVTRGRRKGALLAKPRRASTDAGCFHQQLLWHKGATGASLWGPMMRNWADNFRRCDTLALVLLAATGSTSRAVAAWRRAITGETH